MNRHSNSSAPSSLDAMPALDVVLEIMAPLITWLIRAGVGHAEFTRATKQVFFDAALAEQMRTGGKTTDSALSLLSGLHRKDVRAQREQVVESPSPDPERHSPSLANQVVTRWLSLRWPMDIAFSSNRQRTFEKLVQDITRDVHPRTILNELLRLGVVSESKDGRRVILMRTSFVPTADEAAARDMLRNNLVDHILAGVHNLTTPERGQFLEQSVFADGLTPESVAQLQRLSNELWRHVLTQTVKTATPLCEADVQQGGRHRMRVGMFFYSEPT